MTDAEFEAFYERHWKYVYRLCYTYMKSSAEAEDCTEDVFVKVLTGGFEFNDEIHERKWLTVTAMNLCKDRLKSWKHRAVTPIDDYAETHLIDMRFFKGKVSSYIDENGITEVLVLYNIPNFCEDTGAARCF